MRPNPKTGPISILHLEDDAGDAVYFAEELRRAGLDCRITLAQNAQEFASALSASDFDLILSDNTLPDFDGNSALLLARARRPDLPFIFLSGSIGEEAAIDALKSGATDYILKSRTARLAPAIARALEEKAEREERRRAEQALRESEERYALAALGSNDGLWDWDLKAGAIHFSARWKSMLGYAENEIGPDPREWFDRIHPEDLGQVMARIEAHLKGGASKLECEYRIRTRQGSFLWVLCRGMAVRDAAGDPYRMAGSQGDVTERKKAEEQLLYDAFHDSLTGLFNRNLFLNHLEKLLWAGRRKGGPPFSVVLLGLDRFGSLNSSLGRPAADLILKEAAQRIAAKMRPGDTLARLGGDEFAILMEGPENPGEAIRLAKDLQDALQGPFRIGEQEAFVTASAGIVHGTSAYQGPDEILRDAGLALSEAKSQGKASFAVFDVGMHAQAVAILNLDRDLRRAVARDEFIVHYQPIVELATGKLAGFEALARWMHPGRGLVPPMEFIPFAEEIGLIDDIGRTVLEKACRQMSAWREAHPRDPELTISVNVSGRQFRQPDLIGQIRDILARMRLDPNRLKLEITETAIMDDPKAAARMLAEMRESGIQLQIDDFGTGYSSLAYLHRFPVQALKIDRSFVGMIGPAGENAQIAATVTALAHNLGMQVIAEGIETPDHLRRLREMGCEYGQGYHFSRPVDADAAGKLIAGNAEWR
jgi:diguanylate cyclase (GGDEF)-like protein/PAS domain S-box-containing protein